ncbi:MAG TPA: isoprenylcysteine carboxylmethyltransferase family protein [Paraburkholderia sp.]|nr:isoprenylcysteine carboxylmethyltransferase family protein [Paraburkholderia sp.]
MIRKILTMLVAAFVIFVVPSLFLYADALSHSKWWAAVAVCILASLTQPAYSPLDRRAPAEDRGTASQLVWTVYLCLIGGVFESLTLRMPDALTWTWVSSLALAVALLGTLLRAWAVARLGRFFTWHVRVQSGQSVISTGPYRLVRHPSYTGAWLLYVGLLLAIDARIAATLMGLLLFYGFARRIRYEESLMRQTFGDEYAAYCLRVKRLVPLIW